MRVCRRLKKRGRMMKAIKILLVYAIALGLAMPGSCAEVKTKAHIVITSGSVELKKTDKDKDWIGAKPDMSMTEGYMIKTGKDSSAVVNIKGEPESVSVELKENSTLKFTQLSKEEELGKQATLLDLSQGGINIKAKNIDSEKYRFEVKTPTSVVVMQSGSASFDITVERVDK